MLPTLIEDFCFTINIFDVIFNSCEADSYKIYKLVEENEVMKWDKLAIFGTRTYEFPAIIAPMTNEKFIFFPKKVRYDSNSVDDLLELIEVWDFENQTLTRLSMELSRNFHATADFARLLIVQV